MLTVSYEYMDMDMEEQKAQKKSTMKDPRSASREGRSTAAGKVSWNCLPCTFVHDWNTVMRTSSHLFAVLSIRYYRRFETSLPLRINHSLVQVLPFSAGLLPVFCWSSWTSDSGQRCYLVLRRTAPLVACRTALKSAELCDEKQCKAPQRVDRYRDASLTLLAIFYF